MIFIDVNDTQSLNNFRTKQLEIIPTSDTGAMIKHLDTLVLHIRYVQEAGNLIGVDQRQILIHDQSKFSKHEFMSYARHFFGGGDPGSFSRGWLHHIHNNKHHWQYWIFPDGFHMKNSDMEGDIVHMPDSYALEMVADWMGASMAYTGSWDMTEWLQKNYGRIKLHSRTNKYVRSVLDELGYADVMADFSIKD